MKNKNFWLIALFVFLLDFVSKELALMLLEFEIKYHLYDVFSLQRIFNSSTILLNLDVETYGIHPKWLIYFMFTCSLILTYGIYWVSNEESFNKNNSKIEFLGKGGMFIILGAIWGNVIDRLFRPNGVIDFLRLDISENSAPIINIADIMIFVGNFFILMAWTFIVVEKLKEKNVKIFQKI